MSTCLKIGASLSNLNDLSRVEFPILLWRLLTQTSVVFSKYFIKSRANEFLLEEIALFVRFLRQMEISLISCIPKTLEMIFESRPSKF